MNYIFLFFILLNFAGFSQDTLLIEENAYYGNKIIQVNGSKDTVQYEFAKNGKLLSIYPITAQTLPVHYIRFYSNGKKMWDKTMKNTKENGNAIFYSESGKQIAELYFENGKITDTLFVHPKVNIFLGEIEYSSIVYGGIELENGESNVSEATGAMPFYPFKLVEVNVKTKTEHYYATDRFGVFFIGTPRKDIVYGFFPENYPKNRIQKHMLFPENEMLMSGSNAWSLSKSFIASPNCKITEIRIISTSIGYAP